MHRNSTSRGGGPRVGHASGFFATAKGLIMARQFQDRIDTGVVTKRTRDALLLGTAICASTLIGSGVASAQLTDPISTIDNCRTNQPVVNQFGCGPFSSAATGILSGVPDQPAVAVGVHSTAAVPVS